MTNEEKEMQNIEDENEDLRYDLIKAEVTEAMKAYRKERMRAQVLEVIGVALLVVFIFISHSFGLIFGILNVVTLHHIVTNGIEISYTLVLLFLAHVVAYCYCVRRALGDSFSSYDILALTINILLSTVTFVFLYTIKQRVQA